MIARAIFSDASFCFLPDLSASSPIANKFFCMNLTAFATPSRLSPLKSAATANPLRASVDMPVFVAMSLIVEPNASAFLTMTANAPVIAAPAASIAVPT